uniref:Uncharacterized protein n=1 Tax=Anguilla anguilla TaxID=7936 RepID=A0A0E9X3J4_ANGAN
MLTLKGKRVPVLHGGIHLVFCLVSSSPAQMVISPRGAACARIPRFIVFICFSKVPPIKLLGNYTLHQTINVWVRRQ